MTYDDVLEEVRSIVDEGDDVVGRVVRLLQETFDHYSWLGIYLVEGDDLVLGP